METRVHGTAPPGLEEGAGTKATKDHHSKQDRQESVQEQLRRKVHQTLGAQADLR